ncbi:amidase signature domain-containing protein [Sparassis latifolia]
MNVGARCRSTRPGSLSFLRRSVRHSSWQSAVESKNVSVNALVYAAPAVSPSHDTTLPLHGFSLAVKDIICTKSMPTTCSSVMLRGFKPPFDATVVELLQDNGAVIVGKANCDEFAMGSLNIHSVHGPVINPYQPTHNSAPWADRERRSAGGSSGGSAAAVAAGMCDAALATDTGGSIRLPASYCGVAGHKPSYGLISRWGVVSFADSLDCVGVVAQKVRSIEKIHNVLSKYDPKDPTSAKPEVRERALQICQEYREQFDSGSSLSGLRIGIAKEYFPAELQPSVVNPIRRLLDALKSRGASLVPVSLPSTPYALSAYYVISSAEASSNMARYDGIEYGSFTELPPGADATKAANVYAHTRSRGFGKEVRKRMLLGTYALSADAFDNYFLQAQQVRNLIKSDYDRVFRVPNLLATPVNTNSASLDNDGVHVMIHPSAIRTAPPLPAETDVQSPLSHGDGLDTYVQDVLTVPASLAGLPALNISAGVGEDGWPVGVSVVGQWGCDQMVLDVGKICEESIPD